jgi:hypothetical protein
MSVTPVADLPPAVHSYLRRFALRRSLQHMVRRAGLAAFVTLAWALIWCLIDRVVALPWGVRLTLLLTNIAAALWLVGPAVVRMIRGADWLHTAREIERREPDWRERLATLASRALGPKRYVGSPQLLAALAADVETEASRRLADELLPWSQPLRPWIVTGVLLLMIALLGLMPALDLLRLARRYLTPLANVAPAATTRLFVTPGDVRIAAGETLRVRTSVQRMLGSTPALHVRLAGDQADDWIEQPMSAMPESAFEARVPNLERDIEYFVTGGDARSDIYRAHVLRRPAVVALRAQLEYPPYLKLPPRQIESSNATLEAPLGSQITLEIESTEPLASATVTLGATTVATAPGARANLRRATFAAQKDTPLSIRMTSSAGVEGEFVGGSIKVLHDRPPVLYVAPQPGQTPPAKLNYHALDDLALSRIDAEISRGYGERKVLELPLIGDVREQSAALALDPAALVLQPGEIVDVQIRVEDRAGQFTVSQPVQLIVSAVQPSPPPATSPSPDRAQELNLQEFSESLDAYFNAISRPK